MKNLKLEQHLCHSIYSAWGAINRMYKPFLDDLDLTYTQYIVLTALWEQDNQTVKRLGERLYLGSNTLTPVTKKLEAKKLVQRARDKSDDRLINIFLTEKGRKLSQDAVHIPFCIPEVTNIPVEHLAQLRDQVQELRERIEVAGSR